VKAPPAKSRPVPVEDTGRKNGEVTIMRRLYRSGESEYLIDGRPARLRDIQELFMGTGLGPESYAIIEQGRIGQILSSKPQDRRSVIEEAAGITRFKTRKRLAEAKLESAKQNLARVYDILEEVTRQVNSLKRQASKARRYGELKGELEARLRVVLSGQYRLLERDAAKTAIDLNLASAELKSLGERVAEKEQAHERQQAACYGFEQQLTEARRQLAEMRVEAERTRGRLESQVKESGAIEQRIAQAENESRELGLRLGALDQEIAAHRQNVEVLEEQIAQSRGRMAEINRQRESLQAKMLEREQAIESGRQLILRLLGEASTLKNQLAQIEEYLAGIERETARSAREEQVAAAEIERLEASRKQLSETMAQRQLELESVTGERRHTEEQLANSVSPPPRCARPSTRSRMRSRKSARARNRSNRCWPTAPTPPNPSSVSSPRSKKATPPTSSPWACWPTMWKSTPSSKSPPKSSFTTSWNTWW
jgi:chromosome segregation protein